LESKGFIDISATLGGLDKRCYGQFIEHLGKCIYGGIWVGEDSRIPNFRGFRLDVLRAIKKMQPRIMRWPGGNFSSGYHWLDGVGPREKRVKRLDMAWGAEEPNTFGTDEFLELCRLVDAEPFIVVNAGNGTPEEAAKWVEYCNSRANTYYASLRRRYGHHDPYCVKIWGIGNELYGRWQVGFCLNGSECARRTLEFANEMRKVDPTIRLVAVGCEDPEWNLEMIKNAGEYFDYLSVHIYIKGERPYRELAATSLDIERRLRNIYGLIQSARRRYDIEREIGIAFDEWNVWHPEAKAPLHEQVTTVGDAILTGGILNALHRLCVAAPIGGFAQTVNVLPLIIALEDGGILLTPQYLVFKLYSTNSGDIVLKTTVDTDHYISSELREPVPFIDLSATITKDGKTVYLHVVNRHETEDSEMTISFRRFKPKRGSQLYVAGEKIQDKNTPENPRRVMIQKSKVKVAEGKIMFDLPAHSINIIKVSGQSSIRLN